MFLFHSSFKRKHKFPSGHSKNFFCQFLFFFFSHFFSNQSKFQFAQFPNLFPFLLLKTKTTKHIISSFFFFWFFFFCFEVIIHTHNNKQHTPHSTHLQSTVDIYILIYLSVVLLTFINSTIKENYKTNYKFYLFLLV